MVSDDDVVIERVSAFERVTRERVAAVKTDVADVKVMVGKVWEAIESVRKDLESRLPPWVTFVMSAQSAIIGAMATWILSHL